MTVRAPSHRVGSLSAAVALTVVMGGCGDGSDKVVATVAEQRAKWEASGIETYEFTMFWGAFIAGSGEYDADDDELEIRISDLTLGVGRTMD